MKEEPFGKEEAGKCIETFLELALQECKPSWNRTGRARRSRARCRRRSARVSAGLAVGFVSPPIRTWSYLVAGVALESNLLNCVCKITGGEASASACNEGERSQKKL